jgi:Holliday junction resolvasome RuvABC endonuclease subunit
MNRDRVRFFYCGFDPGLERTGAVLVRAEAANGPFAMVEWATWSEPPDNSMSDQQRIARLTDDASEWAGRVMNSTDVCESDALYVAIEYPTTAKNVASLMKQAGILQSLWEKVRRSIPTHGVVVVVSPSRAKLAMTGSGTAKKAVIEGYAARYIQGFPNLEDPHMSKSKREAVADAAAIAMAAASYHKSRLVVGAGSSFIPSGRSAGAPGKDGGFGRRSGRGRPPGLISGQVSLETFHAITDLTQTLKRGPFIEELCAALKVHKETARARVISLHKKGFVKPWTSRKDPIVLSHPIGSAIPPAPDAMTTLERAALVYILDYWDREGQAPLLHEIGKAIGVSRGSAHYQVKRLIGHGHLIRVRGATRGIEPTPEARLWLLGVK